MSAREVIHYGRTLLRKKCEPVTDFNDLDDLIDDMFDTMYEENGIGSVSYTHLTLPTN